MVCGVSFFIDLIMCTLIICLFLIERCICGMTPQLDEVGCGDGPYGLCMNTCTCTCMYNMHCIATFHWPCPHTSFLWLLLYGLFYLQRPHPGMGKPSTSHQPLLADSLVPSTSCNVLSPTTSSELDTNW